MSVGFKRSTDNLHSMNGFVIGMSIPVFSNRKMTKVAKAQVTEKKLTHEAAQLEIDSKVFSLHNEALQLQEALKQYDTALILQSLDLQKTALEEGHITLTQYFIESDQVFKSLLQYLSLERDFQLTMAQLQQHLL